MPKKDSADYEIDEILDTHLEWIEDGRDFNDSEVMAAFLQKYFRVWSGSVLPDTE